MTYQDLKDFLETLTSDQLAMTCQTYCGDIDDVIEIFGTCINSDEEMGESMKGFSTEQPFLQLA